jgi:hypothetical protein
MFQNSFKHQKYFKTIKAKDNFVCHSACKGCWGVNSKDCQFCKTFKLEDHCVNHCGNEKIDDRFTYVADPETRLCKYCHNECLNGCKGPVSLWRID